MTTISTAPTFDAVDERFRNKIAALQICADLRGGWAADTITEFQKLNQELQALRQDVVTYRSIISNVKKDMTEARILLDDMHQLSVRLAHMKANLPSHLPRANATPSVEKISPKAEVEETGKKVKPVVVNSQEKVPKKQGGKSPIPTIQYVTIKEFESVPKYIKGRLQYDQINVAVDEFNKTIETKYNLMRRPRSKISDVEMKIVTACRQQENQETRGVFFVVDNDIKRCSGLKLDTMGRSILTVLRTLRRIREVRGPGSLVRYAVL